MSEPTTNPTPAKPFSGLMQGNRAKLWTTLGGGVLIFVIWQLGLVVVALCFPVVKGMLLGKTVLSAHQEAFGAGVLMLGGFGPAFVAVILWRKWMEKRPVATLFTRHRRFRWGLALASVIVVGSIGLSQALFFDPQSLELIKPRLAKFSAEDWLILTAAYAVGICVQATFEEVFIRGWLLQHVARFVPTALGSVVATSIIFSALHLGHPGWATYLATFLFGLAFGWSVIRLNGLEAAIGAHVANNFVGALLVGQMVSGNPPSMDARDLLLFVGYLLGFLLFVEVWARFFENPSRV